MRAFDFNDDSSALTLQPGGRLEWHRAIAENCLRVQLCWIWWRWPGRQGFGLAVVAGSLQVCLPLPGALATMKMLRRLMLDYA